MVNEKLAEIKCPKCQAKDFKTKSDSKDKSYIITCNKCQRQWENIDHVVNEYKDWCTRAAMMISIRKREQELISKILNYKNLNDTIIMTEEFLEDDDAKKVIHYFIQREQKDRETIWRDLYSQIKICNRAEKLLLIKIIELCKRAEMKSHGLKTLLNLVQLCSDIPPKKSHLLTH
jgi:hypothetical protein